MTDKAQVAAQIRFALEQLSERNGQHEWEHLCRHLTRARICSNILPATGPVQAGGDQGRDFETFRTFLDGSNLAGQSFVGLTSDTPLAFACTLEQQIVPKIRSDVATIMASGTPVGSIYIYCTRPVPVARRHELQTWARETHHINLEILDGAAIAELLAESDIFWIAERFLHLPAELLPSLPPGQDTADWYGRALDRWRRESRPAQTFADFAEIRAAARAALGPFSYDEAGRPRHQYERPELPFWIDRLDEIIEADTPVSLHRRAFYEATVLRLRGLGTLHGQEERLHRYLAQIPNLDDPASLTDMQVLLAYLWPAGREGLHCLPEDEITRWFDALAQRLVVCLGNAKRHRWVNEQCALLETQGSLIFNRSAMQGVLNTAEPLAIWMELAQHVAQAPLFPLEQFADRLVQYAMYLGDDPAYEPLADQIDVLLAERFGQFKAADQCLKRAQTFRAAGDLSRAMAQLHRAKIDWFAEETLGKTLLALNWLSVAYHEQGLLFAAKYYALASAYIVLHTNDLQLKPLLARSLSDAAECDYAMGAWHNFLALATAASIFYPHFAHDPTEDFNRPDGFLAPLLFHLTTQLAVTQSVAPAIAPLVRDQIEQLTQRIGFGEIWKGLQEQVAADWADWPARDVWEQCEEQLSGAPWSDAGPRRSVHWRAHGIAWEVMWSNDYETTLVAEAFLAALQIILSDLAGYDLCLLRSTLQIALSIATDEIYLNTSTNGGYRGFSATFMPSNAERRAVVSLPPYRLFRDGSLSSHDLRVGALSVVSMLLADVSLLPTKRYYQVLEERFAQGLAHKLLIGAPYGQCLSTFLDAEEFHTTLRAIPQAHTQRPFRTRRPDAIPWINSPGPGYEQAIAQVQIRNRYEGFTRPIVHTLRRLRAEPAFLAVVATLRAEGWKDWHILSAIFHITVNFRISQRRIVLLSPDAEMEAYQRLAHQHESLDALPVPLTEYTEAKLRQQLPLYLVTLTKTYDLELHQETPDIAALDDFFTYRYNFWTDDVEHNDPFTSCHDTSSSLLQP